jgi:hypothetical protein
LNSLELEICVAVTGLDVDFSVEMSDGDAVLEVPWAADDGSVCYHDLHDHPELIEQIVEACRFPELAEFLRHVNAPSGAFETVKCDAWASTQIEPAEEILQASHKHGSYCDLILRDCAGRESFPSHEVLVRRMADLLRKAPEIPAAVEFVVRRCVFHDDNTEGCAITCFVTGYGDDGASARRQWGIAVKLVENVLAQVANRG